MSKRESKILEADLFVESRYEGDLLDAIRTLLSRRLQGRLGVDVKIVISVPVMVVAVPACGSNLGACCDLGVVLVVPAMWE